MGTSSPGGGSRAATPLVPDWADAPAAPADGPLQPTAPNDIPGPVLPTLPEPPPATTDRWRDSRAQYTRFAGSGGASGRALRSALAGYIARALGGSTTAARRMGASQETARSLGGVLGDFSARGVDATLNDLGLAELVGRPLSEVLVSVLDRVCPPGGTLDEAIARDAYLQAVIDCTVASDDGDVVFSESLASQIMESFVANSICLRIINDIGTKGQDAAPSVAAATHVEEQLRDFVQGAVHDAMEQVRADGGSIDRVEATRIADELYPAAWDLLLALAEKDEE